MRLADAIAELLFGEDGLIEPPKPKPSPVAKIHVDLPVRDMRIGMPYFDGRRKGVISEVIPLGRRDRTRVEVVVKFPNKASDATVKHYRHEMIGTFETEI